MDCIHAPIIRVSGTDWLGDVFAIDPLGLTVSGWKRPISGSNFPPPNRRLSDLKGGSPWIWSPAKGPQAQSADRQEDRPEADSLSSQPYNEVGPKRHERIRKQTNLQTSIHRKSTPFLGKVGK